MSIETISTDLPPDAVFQPVYDADGALTHYKLITSKDNVPYLAKYVLEGLDGEDKKLIPTAVKEDIVRETGIGHVVRLPSVLRWTGVGVAAGIVLKALSNDNLNDLVGQNVVDMGTKVFNAIPLMTSKIAPVAAKAMEAVASTPYIAASAIVGAAVATAYVPQKITTLISDAAEGAVSFTARVGEAVVDTLSWCWNHPTTTLTTAAVSFGFFYRNDLGAATGFR